jgi:cystathionine beta-lyase/cystathionine gamma-synthase
VCGSEPFVDEVKRKMAIWGQAPDPFACWLLERGLKTLEVRVKRQNETALDVAEWCSTRPEITKVHYSGLPSHPDHEIAKATMDGFGGMLGIELRGGGPAALKFLRKLQLFTHAASLGGVDSLVIEPRYSSHEHMTPEERAKIGIPDGFVRVSIGLENADDLILDLEQALAQ